MDLFGIEQQPQVHDKVTLQYNKEQILAYFKNCPWNHLFDFVERALISKWKYRASLKLACNFLCASYA